MSFVVRILKISFSKFLFLVSFFGVRPSVRVKVRVRIVVRFRFYKNRLH